MFLTDDVIIGIVMPLLEFCHFVQLRAVNSHIYNVITNYLEENNLIIKKGTQLIILKGQFRVRGANLFPFSDTMRLYSISSQNIIDRFNERGKGAIFRFSDLEHANNLKSSTTICNHQIRDQQIAKPGYGTDFDHAVYCAKSKINLIVPPNQLHSWNDPNGGGKVIGLVSNEFFDLVWHYDFLTGIRVYVNVCLLM